MALQMLSEQSVFPQTFLSSPPRPLGSNVSPSSHKSARLIFTTSVAACQETKDETGAAWLQSR